MDAIKHLISAQKALGDYKKALDDFIKSYKIEYGEANYNRIDNIRKITAKKLDREIFIIFSEVLLAEYGDSTSLTSIDGNIGIVKDNTSKKYYHVQIDTDESGDVIIDKLYDQQYDEIGLYKDGFAIFKLGDSYGHIDLVGKCLKEGKFSNVTEFNNGVSIYTETVGDTKNEYLINSEGKCLGDESYTDIMLDGISGAIVYKDSLCGYIKLDGTFLYEPCNVKIEPFNGNDVTVFKYTNLKLEPTANIMNTCGELEIKESKFIDILPFKKNSDITLARTSEGWFTINKKGQII